MKKLHVIWFTVVIMIVGALSFQSGRLQGLSENLDVADKALKSAEEAQFSATVAQDSCKILMESNKRLSQMLDTCQAYSLKLEDDIRIFTVPK